MDNNKVQKQIVTPTSFQKIQPIRWEQQEV
jgi:hypothetical protein